MLDGPADLGHTTRDVGMIGQEGLPSRACWACSSSSACRVSSTRVASSWSAGLDRLLAQRATQVSRTP